MANRGNEFTKVAHRYTPAYAAGSAALLFVLLLAVFRLPIVAATALAIGFGAATLAMWTRGGLGRRMASDPGEPLDTKELVTTLMAILVVIGLVIAI